METSDQHAVDATALTKSYGTVPVLSGVDLRMPRGTVLALLGPNGAGKTTTVRILSTLLRADGGRARVAGFDVVAERRQVRSRISLTGQYAAVDELQTGAENLRMVGRLRGLNRGAARRRADELLDQFDLVDAASRHVASYSGGMRRRLDLAASLIGNPSVIFLDEPTTGLDLPSRKAMWTVVAELVRGGASVFLTTQYLEEADRLADHIAVLDDGHIVAQGTPAELKRHLAEQQLELTLRDRQSFSEAMARLGHAEIRSQPSELTIRVPTDGSADHVRALLDELDPDRSGITSFAVHGTTLDDVFLALTGHAAARPELESTRV